MLAIVKPRLVGLAACAPGLVFGLACAARSAGSAEIPSVKAGVFDAAGADPKMRGVPARWLQLLHRRAVLALLAHAFLSVLVGRASDGYLDDDPLIPLTRHEIRRLFTGLSQQPPAARLQLHWSRWRRRHQHTARAYYQHRALAAADRNPA